MDGWMVDSQLWRLTVYGCSLDMDRDPDPRVSKTDSERIRIDLRTERMLGNAIPARMAFAAIASALGAGGHGTDVAARGGRTKPTLLLPAFGGMLFRMVFPDGLVFVPQGTGPRQGLRRWCPMRSAIQLGFSFLVARFQVARGQVVL